MLDTLLSMTWRDTLFLHWPVEPETVRERLPARLDLDTFDGRAWLGVVAFVMEDIGPRGVPLGLTFPEVNLRTYVRDEERSAIYFFNLDADDPLGVPVARWLYRLAYYRADVDVARRDDEVVFRSRRTHPGVPSARFDAIYGPAPDAEPFGPDPGTLASFLAERYRFYTASENGSGRLYYGDINHEPWELREGRADVRTNTLFEANGFDHPSGEPRCHYCPAIDVRAGLVRRAELSDEASNLGR